MDPFESLKNFVCEDDTDHTPYATPEGIGPRRGIPWSDEERELQITTNPYFDRDNQVEAGKKGGKITRENNLGIFNPEYDRTPAAKLGGSKGSRAQIDNNIGIWGMTPEQQSERSKRGAKTTTSQRWKCLVTGHISSPGGLSNHQKGLGIDYKDKSLRVRITHL
ncbi:hypothetical protein [Synechococcus phage S-B05]|nr:hypothetical protein [Synechococcus phage S-B05]